MLVSHFKSARRTVSVAKRALRDISTIVVVTLIFMYITSLFIMLLFGPETKPGQVDYGSFQKTWDSLTFLLYGAVNWPDMMMPAYEQNKLWFLFFGAIAAFGCWILMNLVFAAVYEGFVTSYTNFLTAQYTHELLGLLLAFQLLTNFPKHVEDWIDSVPFPHKTRAEVQEIIQEIVRAFKKKGYSSVNRLISAKNNSVVMHDVEVLKKQVQQIVNDALQCGPLEDNTHHASPYTNTRRRGSLILEDQKNTSPRRLSATEQQVMYYKIFVSAFDQLLVRSTRASVEMRTMVGTLDVEGEKGTIVKGEEGLLSMSKAFGEESDEPLYFLLDVSGTRDLHLEEFMALHAYLGLRLHYSAPRWATAGTEVVINNVELHALLSVNEVEQDLRKAWSTLLHMPASLQRAMGIVDARVDAPSAFERDRVVKVGDRVTFEHPKVPGRPLKGTVAGIVESKFTDGSLSTEEGKLNIRLTGVYKYPWIKGKGKLADGDGNDSTPMMSTPLADSGVVASAADDEDRGVTTLARGDINSSRGLAPRASFMQDINTKAEVNWDANVP
jgi:hypothetical protein